MIIKQIHAENYKTYLNLDLDLSVEADRPIILIGGMNGGGKTTLFDAIHGALYGLEIKDENGFREIFNAGVNDIEGKSIVLQITFTGVVLDLEKVYKLCRTYKVINHKVVSNVQLDLDAIRYSYGTWTDRLSKDESTKAIKKIIDANLPMELSKYFLFDAMKSSELVKEEQISNLIKENISSVMGFNKYGQFETAAKELLNEEKSKRLENEQQKKEYDTLLKQESQAENELKIIGNSYKRALSFSTEKKEMYQKLLQGQDENILLKSKMESLQKKIDNLKKSVTQYKQDMESCAKNLETDVIIQHLASIISNEIALVLVNKQEIEDEKKSKVSDKQLESITRQIVDIIKKQYLFNEDIDIKSIVNIIKIGQEGETDVNDQYYYLDHNDVVTLQRLSENIVQNPLKHLSKEKDSLDFEMENLSDWESDVKLFRAQIIGDDYSLIKEYESNEKQIKQLNIDLNKKNKEIDGLKKRLEHYDFQTTKEPDPKYDMLCLLPGVFKEISSRLLKCKKQEIEKKMRDYLNLNLITYKDTIKAVVLSDDIENISFKIYHINGNEIYLDQLNTGSKQMLMQVLLKVLYELGDYDPPVMIDTVMGVLDKASRATVLENYFPNLARQTILLSTDTEITTDHDFEMIHAYLSKVYTLHRDLQKQCTTISEDYFGLK